MKNYLSPDLTKKITKLNVCGLLSYAIIALSSALGIYLAKKVRDNISDIPAKIEKNTK